MHSCDLHNIMFKCMLYFRGRGARGFDYISLGAIYSCNSIINYYIILSYRDVVSYSITKCAVRI